jgi:putative oxidoreductase
MDIDIVMLIGRILFGGYFLMSGVNHFMKKDMVMQYAKSKKLPNPALFVPATGIILMLGGLSILLGAYVAWGILLLVIFLIPTAFKMHDFWNQSGEDKMTNMRYFMMNMAFVGALLIIYASYSSDWAKALNSVM